MRRGTGGKGSRGRGRASARTCLCVRTGPRGRGGEGITRGTGEEGPRGHRRPHANTYIRADAGLRPHGRTAASARTGRVCADARARLRWRALASARTGRMAQMHSCVRVDWVFYPPGNFKSYPTGCLSHGRPRSHYPIVRPSVRYHPRDISDIKPQVSPCTVTFRVIFRQYTNVVLPFNGSLHYS